MNGLPFGMCRIVSRWALAATLAVDQPGSPGSQSGGPPPTRIDRRSSGHEIAVDRSRRL